MTEFLKNFRNRVIEERIEMEARTIRKELRRIRDRLRILQKEYDILSNVDQQTATTNTERKQRRRIVRTANCRNNLTCLTNEHDHLAAHLDKVQKQVRQLRQTRHKQESQQQTRYIAAFKDDF